MGAVLAVVAGGLVVGAILTGAILAGVLGKRDDVKSNFALLPRFWWTVLSGSVSVFFLIACFAMLTDSHGQFLASGAPVVGLVGLVGIVITLLIALEVVAPDALESFYKEGTSETTNKPTKKPI